MVIGYKGPCESCFCHRGQIKCAPKMTCELPVVAEGCTPVYDDKNRCCPTKYNCGKYNLWKHIFNVIHSDSFLGIN